MKIEKKRKKIKPLLPVGILPTGAKGPAHVTRTKGEPDAKPGLKEGPFSSGFVLPVGKPGLKGFPNREYSPFVY